MNKNTETMSFSSDEIRRENIRQVLKITRSTS